MAIISVKNFTKRFKSYQKEPGFFGSLKSVIKRNYHYSYAVQDVSFQIEPGELVGFIGPNGAGKTTTLKCLSGLLYPTSGQIEVLGHNPFDRKHEFLKQISLVMGQKNQLWWDLPAQETFLLLKEIYEIPDTVFQKNLSELTELMDLKNIISKQVRKLSLGERMKCEIAAQLLHNPKILFLDEPTIGLDVVMQQKIRDFIKEYNKKYKATIILTSHYMNDVKELCERIIVINKGLILYDGKLESIVSKFSDIKRLTLTLNKQVSKNDLEPFGKLISYSYPQAILELPKTHTIHHTNQILAKLPVEDLIIEEPEIDEIIRNIFNTSNP